MKIESLKLRNYKAFQDVTLEDIPAFCVLVGANGTGKTTFFDVFSFLKDCLTYNVGTALQTRGGFKEVVSREKGNENIIIELKFRLVIAQKRRLVTYYLEISNDKGKPIVEREILRYKRQAHGKPFHFIDFRRGEGYAITNEEDFSKPDEELKRDYQKLDDPNMLAIKGLGQFQRFKAANAFRQLIENWHISALSIDLMRGGKDVAGYDTHLSRTGDNLQLVANNLLQNHPKTFNKIVKTMTKRVPGVSTIEPRLTEDGRLLLRFQDDSFVDPFIDKFVSDGTIKMFAYLVLLNDPQRHPLLGVEEPENQLYHSLLVELAEEFRDYARNERQVFVSTHSPEFLNEAKTDEVIFLTKENGYTKVRRASTDTQIVEYMNDGDKMGYLWRQGLFEGVDPQ